ncbi:mucin-17 isoform X9 [Anastrepha ludens]|uniref:mucin-17 isoform X9 n=1 Tax=Anastrepha ludens TaxID=28586 RepID=UPI0023B06572|nr:mucin-17 isoform X9 [Anastrepha ludens]
MELECDLSAIKNEDLLRRMWQQTEDIDHKKEIRSHLYKLRESRLRDLYQGDIMAGNFAKDPFNPSHGDSLVGQNFQSLKSQEVRDSVSPTRDLKFHSMTLNHPNTTGWDVQTSSEVSPDGRAYRTETVATTDGVEKINGGTAEFRGLNEQRASASHQGDDKNFVKKASENSNTHLQERIVVGDENSGRTEMKMSSTTTSSSSQVTSSSSAVEYGGGEPNDARYLMDNTNRQHPGQYPQQQRLTQDQYIQQQQQQRQQQLQQQEFEQTKQYQQQQHQQRVQQQEQEQRQYTEEFNRNRQESSTSRNVDTQQTTEQNRRVVDVDKASPEYQKHVQYLMSQPGEIISNTVEYPKPNVKMITTVKRLPDGTIVKNKRYETEELRPAVDSPRQRTTSSTSQSSTQHRNEQQRREQTEDNVYNRQQNVRNNTTRRSEHDVVDNAEPFAHVPSQQQLVESHPTDHFTDEITNTETKFSSVKKSSRRFSTETTSETIEEFSDHAPPSHAPGIRGKPGSGRPPTQDFSTHGFPSVKPNKPTQEYPTERPHGAPQSQRPDFSTHGFPSVSPNKPTQEYPGDRVRPSDVERLNQRTVTELNNTSSNVPYGSPAVNPNSKITTTKDGDVIIVSSESTRSSKFKTNAERVIETEVVIDGDSSPNRGFPAVKQTSPGGRDSPRYGTPTREYPGSPRRPQPAEDFSTHGFPSVRSPTKQSTDFPANGFPSDRDVAKPTSAHPAPSRIINPDGSVTTISSETKKTIKHNTNREHIIETEIVGDSHQPLPSGLRQPDKITFPPTPQPTDFGTHGFPSVRESAPTNDAYRRQGTPTREYPSSPHKPQPSADFSTHGFPSVKDSAPVRESTPSRDYPSSPRQNQPSQDFSTHGFPSVRTPNKPVSDYSTPSGGFPSTRDTNAPKLMPTQSRPQPSTTTPQKSTTTTDSSQRLISKERDVDATHRAFAASLRCSSPVDSPDHHRSTPRSSVSSTRTFRRDGREGSHDSETSRISSGTVTRSSPSKSVGKTVVTKQTVVKTRNVNGSNETIDLTPQRPTKSPSPNKATTTTTTRITTTRKSPTEVPKPVYPSDNQKSKQAENTFPIINEPLTITKTHFTANDASFLGNEVVEKPCIKKHFYKLGPSDKVINNVDEKSPYSSAPSNHTNRTHPKPKSQVRDDLADVNHEEPIHNQPLSSSVIEPKQRNRSPTGPKSSSPQTICQPFKKEPSVGRRTDVRESTFENTDWQNTIQNSNETQYPVTYDKEPKDEYIETIYLNETPVDTSDYPSKRGEPNKQPYNKNKTEFVTKTTTRIEKFQNNDTFNDTDEFITRQSHEKEPSEPRDTNPVSKKPLDSLGKRPKEGKPIEPSNRKQGEKQPTQPAEKVPGQKHPINNSPSPTRRTSDARTSKTTSTTVKTTRKENIYDVEDDNQPKNTVDKRPNQTDKGKLNDIDHSPTRKPSDQPSNNRPKNIRQQKPQAADDITQPHEPFGKNADIENPDDFSYKIPTNKRPSVPESSPTRQITERKTLKTTSETTRKNKTHPVEDDHQPDEPLRGKPGHERTIDKKKPNDSRPLDVKLIKDDHSPTRTTSDASKLKTSTVTTTVTKIHKNTVSPTRNSKPTDIRSSVPIHKNQIKEKPSEKLPKYTKAAKPAPAGAVEPEQSDDEHIPTGREPAKKPLSKVDDYSETKKSTNIRYVNTNRATSTVQTPSDEKYKPVQRGKSPLSKGPSDIEFSDDDQKIIENIPVETTRYKTIQPTSEDDYEIKKPVPRKPAPENSEEDSNDDNQRSTFITTAIKTVRADRPQPTYQTIDDETRRVQELFNKTDKTKVTKNVNEEFITFEQQVGGRVPVLNRPEDEPGKPSKFNGKEPKSKPTIKNREPDYRVDDDTNISKISSVTTTLKILGRDLPSIKKPSQPEDEKPKVPQPIDTDLSDDDLATHETYETTTTIKGIRRDTVPANVEGEQPRSDNKKFPKPDGGKTRPSKPANSDNDRSPTRTPTEGNTLKSVTITTTTKNTVCGKPSELPHEPADKPTGKTPTLDETERVDALFKTTNKTKHTKNYNEEFINIESQNKETPDGAFISKAPESEPSSPTFKKKGVSPRETFEDRCRQILGMENYGDTPGTYQRKPEDESDQKEPLPVDTTKFEVKIEDCEDDEPNYLNNIKAAIKPIEKPKTHKTSDISDEELVENLVEEVECIRTDTVVPFKNTYPEREPSSETTPKSTRVIKTDIKEEEDENIVNKTTSKLVKKAPSPLPKEEQLEDVELEEFPLSEPESPEKETDDESQPDTVVPERETQYTDEFEIEERTNLVVKTEKKQPLKSDKKLPVKKSPNTSPTRKPSGKTLPSSSYPSGRSTVTPTKPVDSKPKPRETKVVSNTKPISKSPESPDKDTVLRKDKPVSSTKPRTERIQKLDTHTVSNRQPKTPSKESPTSTIKDRLRSSPRNKKPSTTESDSSPDMSPTRLTERRRSSNISVHTEIIIDHSGPKSPKPTKKMPEKLTNQPKKTVPTDTISQTKPFRRFPVTERKESAPVPSVSRKDKDVKMTRSTSEKVMKVTERPVKKTEVSTLEPSAIPKSDRRPNKCFTTKTINLTTTDKLINSEDMENVIIDIQHAKSSREPSPDKIVPTPVPVHLDTGKPRYPDVVQEPEDVPRKKPVITNIPIFEEESNEFINCHISEVKTDRISKLVDLEEDDILDNPTIEAPKSLEYPLIDRPDDDCLLSVHEKVSKFTHTAEEIKKPKASSPFSREFDKTPKVPDNDECLLTVDEKVNKFIKTAEEVSKPITPVREIERPSYTELDEELRKDDCTLSVSQKVNKFLNTAEKLAPTAPQRSPELVAKIVRTISKQSEPEYPESVTDDELTPFSQNHTIEIEKRRQKDILSRPTVFENTTKTNRNAGFVEEEVTIVRNTTGVPEYDEVIPHTRDHTTKLELKRQKDILSRPSIYNKNAKARPQSPSKREPISSYKPQPSEPIKSQQIEYTTKKVISEDNDESKTKAERKPSAPTTKPESRKSLTKPQKSTVAVTRSRFETFDNKKLPLKSSTEPKTSRVPTSSITARKPTNEPKARLPSTSSRKPSSEPDTSSPYTNRRKPFNEPEWQSPQRGARKQSTEPDSHYPGRKPSTESIINYENIESETEFTSTTRRRSSSKTKDYLEMVQTEIERFSPTQKEPLRKIPTQEKQKPQSFSHSPTRKDATSTTKVTQVTERTIRNSSPSECSDIEIVETILERPTQVKEPTPTSTIGRTRVTSDTVAARRNIFENSSTPKGQKPSVSSSPSPVGRRPSYMDHTVSSLEHIRRDSLEVNKHNYSRKSSIDSESNYERRPNSAVKFDVPHKPQRSTSIPEDIDVESIFELEVLESLLETVTSYELRRRIRAQIRLVKKNLLNTEMVDKRKTETKTSKSISSTHKTSTYISNVHNEENDSIHEDIKTKKPYESKPSPKHSPQLTKGGRVPESKDVPKKSPYGYSESRYNKEVTRKTTTNDKTPNGRSESPKRPTKTLHERHHSPEIKSPQGSVKEVYHTTGSSLSTHKEYIRNEQTDYSEESFNSSRRVNQSSERFEKDQSRERSYSPETKSPIRDSRRSPDLKTKSVPGTRTKSPDTGKPTSQRTTSPQGRTPKQRDDLYSISKTTTVKTTHSPERKSSKPRTDESTPIWADRKNLLKSPSSTPRKVPASPSMRTTATKTTTSKSTSQRQTQNRNFEEDSITSSYGIGPTDENGLPLFGIKALKKKKPSQPCEATEEVTGYVIEEKYYSDNKTKPKVERKEYIYSTNADELEEIKKTVEQSRKSSQDDVDIIRKFEKIDKDYVFEKPEAILPDSEDFATSSKYVRRGSVKELSEKFIRKESSQSTTEKSAGYPKAGLILRTSRGPSTDPSGDSYETTTEKYTTTSSSGHAYRPTEGDSDDEYNVQLRQKQSRVFTDYDDNESEQRHLSTRSSSKSTRSFLNSCGETKVVTSMDDALERMRNADYVVEAGDTAEDQEARSLLNKFLGASVIMKGVESVLPTTKQTTTTTITKTSYADDDADSDLLKNKAVKTTRITKTTKSGSSSTPVTRTTCDIEEIWDEELLQALLEQATTYEERRKIRARLRDLMAEREEQQATSTTEKTETKEKDGAVVTTTTKVTTRTVSGAGSSATKPVSPFAKFRQLDKQSSQQSKSPSTPTTPGGTASPSGSARIFQFTDPALNARAATVKEQLLQWCQSKTQEYENVQITNFSASWSDGLAFCALIHHFLPDAFDYSKLTPKSRRHNFELAFTVADEKAGIAPLLDVEDMVEMKRPDWKCVFIYVQSIYRRFRNCQ